MNNEIHVCPNCGAYVMSNDNICPRCDFVLDDPPPDHPRSADSDPPADDTPESERPGKEAALLADVDESAPDQDEGEPVAAEIDRADLPTTRLPEPDKPELDESESDEPGSDEPVLDDTEPAPPDIEAEAAALADPDDVPADVDKSANDQEAEEAPTDVDLPDSEVPTEIDTRDAPTKDITAAPGQDSAPPIEPEIDVSEMSTAQFNKLLAAAEADEQAAPPGSTMPTPPRQPGATERQISIIPPAPFTPPPPPPVTITPSAPIPAYTPPPSYYAPPRADYGYGTATAYLQQRVQAYQRGGYRLYVFAPHEATLTRGKRMGVGAWLLALLSLIGFAWYLLILAVSGFSPDAVYLTLESDGRVYEDGPGAAHIRRSRSRTGRRWGILGLVVFVICFVLAILLSAVAGIVLTQDRYQAAVREAYPAVTLFEEQFSNARANPDDVDLAKDGAVVFAILAGIAAVGLWGGATLFVIGSVHAAAYHVKVPPLPGYA